MPADLRDVWAVLEDGAIVPAVWFSEHGVHVFPVHGKDPAVPKGTSWKDWHGDVARLRNYAVPLSASLGVLDTDDHDDELWVLTQIADGAVPETPFVVSGEPDGYDFSGPTRFDKLFTGIAVETPAWVKEYTGKTGTEDIGPEDTFDGDYGRLLDRAYEKSVKVLASPTGFEPVFWP